MTYQTIDESRRAASLRVSVRLIEIAHEPLARRHWLRLSRTQAGELYHTLGKLLFDDERVAPPADG